MMTNAADRLIADLTMTIKYYADRRETDEPLNELTAVAEHMLETLSCLRRNQVMRAALSARSSELSAALSE